MAIITVGPAETHTTIASALTVAGSTDTVRLVADITESISMSQNIAGFDSDGTVALGTQRTWNGTGSGGNHTLSWNAGVTQRIFLQDLEMDHSSGNADTTKINGKGTGFGLDYRRLIIRSTSGSGSGFGLSDVSGVGALDQIIVDRCNFHGGSGDRGIHVGTTSTANYMTVTNCQFHQQDEGINVATNSTNNVINVYNCTFHDNTNGFMTSSRVTVTNCLFLQDGTGGQTDVVLAGSSNAADFTFCGFEEQSSPFGSNNIFNLVAADEIFNDVTHDLHLKDGARSRNAGTDLSALVTSEYDGLTRPVNGFDLGAFENQNAISSRVSLV